MNAPAPAVGGAVPLVCPTCPPGIECDHDELDKVEMYRIKGDEPVFAEAPRYDASDPRQVTKAKQRSKQRRDQRDVDLRTQMGSPDGRRFVWVLLGRCGVFRATFSPGAPDALRMAHAEGQRNIGLAYLNDIQRLAPAEYLLMVKENGVDAAA